MKYFLDTEFNEFGGELISLALVREDGKSIYLVYPEPTAGYGIWVKEHVVPILWSVPSSTLNHSFAAPSLKDGAGVIANFLRGDRNPVIVTDWPDDIRYFCQAVITGPGEMVALDNLVFHMLRVNAYPTTIEGAIQHNAWWDAMALRELFC